MRKKAIVRLNEGDDGRTLQALPGQEIELKLPENPTTGYRWRAVQEPAPVFRLIGTSFKPGKQPGEPGVHIRRYRVAGVGKGTLKLAYGRSWEPGESAARVFQLQVRKAGVIRPKASIRGRPRRG